MGNHVAGRLIAEFVAAEMAKTPTYRALDVLDRAVAAAKSSPDFSSDAEFESTDPKNPGCVDPRFSDYRDPNPASVLGMLMVEAFAPNGLRDLTRYAPMLGVPAEWKDDAAAEQDSEAATEAWFDEVGRPFSERYGLC